MTSAKPVCAFCRSDKKLTGEHVWPDWTQPYLASSEGKGTHRRTVLRYGKEPEMREWRDDPATSKVNDVCEKCNTGWMSDLETAAKPYLLTMIQGRGRTYHTGGLTLIGTLAAKTALMAGKQMARSH